MRYRGQVPAIVGLILLAGPLSAQSETSSSREQSLTIAVTDESGRADEEHPIYIATNRGGWNPGATEWRMTRGADDVWRYKLPKPTSPEPMQFKFTLGDWAWVECAKSGADIPNRTLPDLSTLPVEPGERPVLHLSVARFRTGEPQAVSKITGTIRRIRVPGGGGVAKDANREIQIWLPPGYEQDPERRYPVLYLNDGQNVFERPPGVPGEWHADEIATRLIKDAEIPPVIIVGIPHSGAGRMEEYVPFKVWARREPAGKAYVAWLTDVLIPRVEREVRIDPDRRVLGGASLGATISLYAHTRAPAHFSGLLIESLPELPDRTGQWRLLMASTKQWPERVFIGVGDREVGGEPSSRKNLAHVAHATALSERLRSAGVGDDRRLLIIGEGDQHNEDAWARRLPDALRFLFPHP